MSKLILSTNIRNTDAQWFRPTSIDNIVDMFSKVVVEHGPCQCVIDGDTASINSIIISMLTFTDTMRHTHIVKQYEDPPGEVTFNTYSFDGKFVDGATAMIADLHALKPFLTELFKKWSYHPIGTINNYRDQIESERQMVDRLIINICTLSET